MHLSFPRSPWAALGLLCTLLVSSSGLAQGAPSYMPIQGSLAAEDGTPRDGSFAVEFRLYEQDAGGTAFYAESQDIQVENGFFTAYLGDGDVADLGDGTDSPAFDLMSFVGRPRGVVFLGVSVGDDDEMTPRLQLGSVPFAAYAEACGDSGSLGGQTASSFAAAQHTHQPTDVGAAPASHTHDATDIVGGKLPVARVPELGELSGAIAPGQLPDLSDTYAPTGHSHPPPSNTWYGIDTDALSQLITSQHAFCALTRVKHIGLSSGSHTCSIDDTGDGTWHFIAAAGPGERTLCSARCF